MEPPLDVMIVEDEPMLAFQLEDEVIDAGHRVVGSPASAAEALAIAREARPRLVLMDVQLADGASGIAAARTLAGQGGTCVVFVTASAKALPADFGGAVGVIEKPWSPVGIRAALGFLARALGGGVLPPPPASLRLAPGCLVGANGRYDFAPLPASG